MPEEYQIFFNVSLSLVTHEWENGMGNSTVQMYTHGVISRLLYAVLGR